MTTMAPIVIGTTSSRILCDVFVYMCVYICQHVMSVKSLCLLFVYQTINKTSLRNFTEKPSLVQYY
jgi:phage-related minor tail protein